MKVVTHGNKWLRFSQLRNRSIFLEGIQQLLTINNTYQTNSIWLIGGSTQHTFHRKGLRYQANDSNYQQAVTLLKEAGVTLGLHSVSTEPILNQTERLSVLLDKPILHHRSHFLQFNPHTLYAELQQAGIPIDYSLGSAREIQLPGVSTPIHGVNSIPTVLFDNSFFFHPPELLFEQFKQVLKTAQQRQQDVAILFHPENFLIQPALWEYYQEVLHLIKSTH
jgi:hypothetical protein